MGNLLDKIFRDKLKSRHLEFDPDDWTKMESLLDGKTRKPKVFPFWYFGVGLGLILLTTLLLTRTEKPKDLAFDSFELKEHTGQTKVSTSDVVTMKSDNDNQGLNESASLLIATEIETNRGQLKLSNLKEGFNSDPLAISKEESILSQDLNEEVVLSNSSDYKTAVNRNSELVNALNTIDIKSIHRLVTKQITLTPRFSNIIQRFYFQEILFK